MKRFEFRLERILELRREQADLERGRLQGLLNRLREIEDEKNALVAEGVGVRRQIDQSSRVSGQDLFALAEFERHVENQSARLDRLKEEAAQRVAHQRSVVMESERKVTLLVKLRLRRLAAWTIEEQKELETLAAESYLARFNAALRDERANRASQELLRPPPRQ